MIGVASNEVEGDAGSGAVERVDCNEAHFSVEAEGGGGGGRGERRQKGEKSCYHVSPVPCMSKS